MFVYNKHHQLIYQYISVVLKLFVPAVHLATFPNFAAHSDQSADLFWSAPSFPRFPLPDTIYACIIFHKGLEFLCNFHLIK